MTSKKVYMNLCSENHEEVCFNDSECPMCCVIEKYRDLLDAREHKIHELKSEIDGLSRELEILQEPVVLAVKVIREEMLHEHTSS